MGADLRLYVNQTHRNARPLVREPTTKDGVHGQASRAAGPSTSPTPLGSSANANSPIPLTGVGAAGSVFRGFESA